MKKTICGKVRDVYEVSGDSLVIVTSDRISAFDVVLSKPVPGKGRILNAISLFWFGFTQDIIPNHIISGDLKDMPTYFQTDEFDGRAVLVKRLKILPFEFVIRGYMFGHMWQSYKENREFCGHRIGGGFREADKLDAPIITPSTKARSGHDEYISVHDVEDAIGAEMTKRIIKVCTRLYETCNNYANSKGLIIADTKFEFGLDGQGNLLLADEIFTPDSSRFWSLSDYQCGGNSGGNSGGQYDKQAGGLLSQAEQSGGSPKSYDKQFVRDWLLDNKINGEMQFANVPDYILSKTAEIYAECLKKLIG